MKNDRGMIKWQPFDSVVSSKTLINSLLKEKSKINRPILSIDEQKEIEEKIIEAYYSGEEINLEYYYDGYINIIKTKIKKIDQISKLIYLNNKRVLFIQIISIH